MKQASYKLLLILPAAALLLASNGCSNPAGPSQNVVGSPETPAHKEAIQTRLQNDPTLHGRYQGGALQSGASPGGPAQAPPWQKPVTPAGASTGQ